MTDGAIQLLSGYLLVKNGKVATADECCCDPCDSCYTTDQFSVTVVVSGSCQSVFIDHYDYAGTYTCTALYQNATFCRWRFDQDDGDGILYVWYCKAQSDFNAILTGGVSGPGPGLKGLPVPRKTSPVSRSSSSSRQERRIRGGS